MVNNMDLDDYGTATTRQYPSCLLEGMADTVPCFMTASSPIPFSEIASDLSLLPHHASIIPVEDPHNPSSLLVSVGRRHVVGQLITPRREGKFKCRRCSKRFKTKGGLNLHLREHQPELYLIRCPLCPFFTYQTANFAKHSAVKHGKDVNGEPIAKDIYCPKCEFNCYTDEQLKLHIARKHTEETDKPFRCEECDYSSVEKAALQKHVSIVHRKEREFECDICGFRSQTSSGLARHHRSHVEAKPHQCPMCPMTYADKKRLRDHLMKHSNIKQFQCSNCKYATNRKDNLKIHIKRNHMPE